MKSKDKNAMAAGFAAWSVIFATFLAVMITGAVSDRAHAGTTASSPPASPAAQSPAKGAHEGIGVHGHWTIDVKNPDGKLARHVEFENGLCIGSGDQLLAQLLTGGVTAGGWQIKLGGPTIPSGAPTAQACSDLEIGNALNAGAMLFDLEQNNDHNSTSGACAATNSSFPIIYCFSTLTPPSTGGGAVSLAGQFTVPAGISSTQITAVSTGVSTCPAVDTSSYCLTNGGSSTDFTGAFLTGVGAMPAAITVVAGQSVSVNVQLSFH